MLTCYCLDLARDYILKSSDERNPKCILRALRRKEERPASGARRFKHPILPPLFCFSPFWSGLRSFEPFNVTSLLHLSLSTQVPSVTIAAGSYGLSVLQANSKLKLLPHSCHESTHNILPCQKCFRNVALNGLRAFANEVSFRTSLSKRRQFSTLVQLSSFLLLMGLEMLILFGPLAER